MVAAAPLIYSFGKKVLGGKNVVKSAGETVSGAGDTYGDVAHTAGEALGTNQYNSDGTGIDKNAFYSDELQGDKNQAQQQFQAAANRQAPTSQSAQLGPAQNAQAQLGTAALGQSINAQNTQLGPAQNANTANINRQDTQFRNQQGQLANQLQQAANGQGPSQAGIQLGAANAAATAQRIAAAASDRGFGNTAASNRQLAYQQGAAQQANAIAAAQTRIQEQQAAQQNLGNVLSNARNQDIGVNTSQAQLGQQTNLANQAANNQFALQQGELNQQTALQNAAAGNQFGLANQNALNSQAQLNQNSQNQFGLSNQAANNQFALQQGQFDQATNLANQTAQLQTMGLNDAQIRAMLGSSTGIDQQTLANQQAYNQLGVQQNLTQQQIDSGNYQAAAANRTAVTTGVLNAVGGAVAKSDERSKKNIEEIDDNDINQFLNTMNGHKYDYKDPNEDGADQKTHFSPMAQELEKSDIGKSLVYPTADGSKMVDYGRGFGALMATTAELNKRLKKLEKK